MTPIVLLHAFPQSSAMWRGVADGLAGAFEVLTPDLPGFGGSPPADWTVDSAADRIAELLTDKPRAVVGGCSMGGYVALAFARRHPDKLAGLVLMNTRADADTPGQKASREGNLRLVAEKGTAALVEKMPPRLLGRTTRATRPDIAQKVREVACAQSGDAVIAGLIALRDRPDATGDLRNIAVPTLVICGEEDELTPPGVGHAMAVAIPNAVMVTIPACGHLSPWESPDAVAAAIRGRFAP